MRLLDRWNKLPDGMLGLARLVARGRFVIGHRLHPLDERSSRLGSNLVSQVGHLSGVAVDRLKVHEATSKMVVVWQPSLHVGSGEPRIVRQIVMVFQLRAFDQPQTRSDMTRNIR